MDYGVYLSAGAAWQTMLAQQTHASNLANAETTGFRSDFNWTGERAFNLAGVEGRIPGTRTGAEMQLKGSRLVPGDNQWSGRELDAAIVGEGWFVVQSPTGDEAFTRGGNFVVNGFGELVTTAGLPVLGEDGVMVLPVFSGLQIASDGMITVVVEGGDLVEVGRLRRVNPPQGTLQKGTDGLFRYTGPGAVPDDPDVAVLGGALEQSNVNAIEEISDYLQLSREFELQIKAIRTFDQMAARGNELLRSS
ncbi:flagellar basal body rod protein FlgF [Kistimonas scapharcae]|uniref:Flagellar basal-body rod protein FlgF n=1 Tax=Kistimonas scapharcae TaxID=1036133 RepID=A0ABP8V6M6_9GAMM